ncbi:MAG: A/G-specific adenine glycosylase, partial [Xanthomonadales bacterium]|nr:A/G-specific adenine glycosylase [Xanthomonadales bacterium]
YRVWVSEIMLQQTQVATVIPYFERFMARFADLPTLASADLDDVLALWSGLGYYARARNLHAAARICVEEFGGKLPDSAEALSELPGIGASTANAIVSQAQDIPAVVLDGNVRRVMSRHAGIEGWYGRKPVAESLWSAAASRLPGKRGADYTQAIMDLGATLCTARNPGCDACPVRSDCVARAEGRVAELPSPKPRTRVTERDIYMLIARREDGAVLLERRPPSGIWGGLWCLPEGENVETLARDAGLDPQSCSELPPLSHRLTHLALTIHPRLAHAGDVATGVREGTQQQWFGRADWPELGLPRPVARLLQTHIGDQ